MKCFLCGAEITDEKKGCPKCGWSVDLKLGVAIRKCGHCQGKGECKKEKTMNVVHSCAYCFEKADIADKRNVFVVVPCAYCQGEGCLVKDLKPQKQQQQGQGKKKGGQNGQR